MKIAINTLCLLIIVPLLMGNQSCEQSQAQKGRQLKRQIELAKIEASRINFPGAANFDFEYVMNAQIYDAISAGDRFVVPFDETDPFAPKLSTADRQVLVASGFQRSAGTATPLGSPDDPNVCVTRLPLLKVAGQVRSFEVIGGGGLWFGFRGPTQGNGSVGAGGLFEVQSAQMEVGLVAYHPLTRTAYGTGFATPKHTKVDINLAIDFGQFSLGPRFFFQSRLAGVTMSGLKTALGALSEDLDKKATNEKRPLWETRVVKDLDDFVTIRAGRRHGIQVGDEFEVYNMDHYWEDDSQPCRSRYLGAVRNSNEPIAILKVTGDRDLGDEFARLQRIKSDADGTIAMPGAQVIVHRLAQPEAGSGTGTVQPKTVR